MATTPGLCSGLSIGRPQFKYDVDLENFKAMYAPWLSIISQNQSFHLVFNQNLTTLPQEHMTSLAQYLLCEATPTPTNIYCGSARIFYGILSLKGSCDSVIHFDLQVPWSARFDHNGFLTLPVVFPQLESFLTISRFTLAVPSDVLGYPTLRSLAVLNIDGATDGLARLCMGLPCLQELKIASEQFQVEAPPTVTLDKPFVHPGLETLLIVGQDLLVFMAYLTLPSLKFFGLELFRTEVAGVTLEDTLPAFFHRSQLSNLLVSLRGQCFPHSLAAVTRSLPTAATLLLDTDIVDEEYNQEPVADSRLNLGSIKKIVCMNPSSLCKHMDNSSCVREITVLVPGDILLEGEMQRLRKEMQDRGLTLEQCSTRLVEDTLNASHSTMAEQWMA